MAGKSSSIQKISKALIIKKFPIHSFSISHVMHTQPPYVNANRASLRENMEEKK